MPVGRVLPFGQDLSNAPSGGGRAIIATPGEPRFIEISLSGRFA